MKGLRNAFLGLFLILFTPALGLAQVESVKMGVDGMT